MKQRILSILLILCMVLSMLPVSAFAAEAHLTVLDTAPATGTVTAGEIYELNLSTVFTDSEGHSLTYTLSGGDFGEHTKITDGTLYFSISTAGEYKPVITAVCTGGETVSHTLTVTVEEAAAGSASQYGYKETPAASVKVYVNLSNDGMPLLSSNGSNAVMAGLEVTVPYFDLSLYGLETYYRYHTENGEGSYTDSVVVERPTLLHLYIYLLERYYMGLEDSKCCKGTSGVLEYAEDTAVGYFNGSEAYSSGTTGAVSISGAATSFFMNSFWGHDCNLKYYRNHMYPLMSAGWGATADYILLSDGDAIDIGMFTDWGFYMEGEFCCFGADVYTAASGSTLNFNVLRWNATDNALEAFSGLDVALYDANWNKVKDIADGETGASASLSVLLPESAGTYYLLGMDVNAGTSDAVNAPAVAIVRVEAPAVPATGVTLDKSELTLAIGTSQTLAAIVTPENTTDTVVWTSSDSAVATVENGVVTAIAEGTATITATAGEVSASCIVTVTAAVPTGGYLSALAVSQLMQASVNGTRNDYPMTPEYVSYEYEYAMLVPDNQTAAYAWATLSETAPEGSTITAKWTNTSGAAKTATVTSGKTTGQFLSGLLAVGTVGNTVTFEVGLGEDIQTYTVNIVRTPTLSGLSLADAEGNTIRTNETFAAATTAYTANTTAKKLNVSAVPYVEGYTVTYNGAENGEITLADGENVITMVVKNEAGYEKTYTLTVNKVSAIEIIFDVTPTDAVVNLSDSFGDRIWPVDGVYTLMAGCDYSYTVTRNGCIGQKNSFNLSESGTIVIELEKAPENDAIDTTIYAQWANFRNGDNHLGITDAPTPYAPEDAELLWAARYGTGWSAAPGSPIIVDDYLITYVGSTIKKLDLYTGEIVAEGTMVGSSSFSIVPATYAEGLIFVGLSNGRIQAFNADTLESVWLYTDPLGGQPNCPITYKDGYIYAGFWGSETKNANFACISITDEDPTQTAETKLSTWTYASAGGFYWAGAYASDKYVVVGTDDGQGGYTSESASLLVFDRLTGAVVDSRGGIRGDIRSNVSYDPDSDRVFFTSKGGVLYNAKLDWTTGKITNFNQIVMTDSKGNEYAMSTCTPSVYNDRIYIGVSGANQFGDFTGHGISVFDLAEDGTMTNAYVYDIKGYPQTSAMVTTAYADEQDGYVYIYLPYNATPGSISVLKDKKGQTEPLTTTDQGYSEVFTPVAPLAQYCICSTIADQYGTIYYKNDSLYMMAITSKIESIDITQMPTSYTRNEDGTWTVEGLQVTSKLKNGLQRDISNYVEIVEDPSSHMLRVAYTYGFDHANYGLKTLTVDLIDLCGAEGHDYLVETVAPTCVEDGYVQHTCQRCGYNYRDNFVTAVGHSYESAATAPTCTEQGYTTHTCAVCGDSYVDSIVAALGHSYESAVTAPTCTEQGYTTHTCTVCGDSYVDSIVAALGHSYESIVTAPTHEKMGYTTHTCETCGHSYVNSYTDALGHTYTGELTKEPTCTEEGVMTFTCDCGEHYTQTIPMLAHSYTAVVTAPTCTEMGYTTYTCDCGHSYVADYVNAAGHDCETEVVEATCLGYGYTTHTCKHCDYSYISEITQPLGHAGEVTDAAEPTCIEEGYTGDLVCSRCGALLECGETIATNCPSAHLSDVSTGAWYHEAVDFAVTNGLMTGMTDTGFGPNVTVSRAMLVTVLYRAAGEPAVDGLENPFSDVAAGTWYTNAVIWAANQGIVAGVTETSFAPGAILSREQLVTMLWRYAQAKGEDVSKQAELSAYKDAEAVSAYAQQAMAWAVAEGIISGMTTDTLAPKGSATRAQIASILQRYLEK